MKVSVQRVVGGGLAVLTAAGLGFAIGGNGVRFPVNVHGPDREASSSVETTEQGGAGFPGTGSTTAGETHLPSVVPSETGSAGGSEGAEPSAHSATGAGSDAWSQASASSTGDSAAPVRTAVGAQADGGRSAVKLDQVRTALGAPVNAGVSGDDAQVTVPDVAEVVTTPVVQDTPAVDEAAAQVGDRVSVPAQAAAAPQTMLARGAVDGYATATEVPSEAEQATDTTRTTGSDAGAPDATSAVTPAAPDTGVDAGADSGAAAPAAGTAGH